MTAPYMTKSSDSIRKNTQYNVSKMSPASKSSFATRKNSHSEFISWKNPHSGFSAAAGSISSLGGGSNPPPSDRQLCCEKKFAKRICFYLATLNDGASPLLNVDNNKQSGDPKSHIVIYFQKKDTDQKDPCLKIKLYCLLHSFH